jgi:hypothetical protein
LPAKFGKFIQFGLFLLAELNDEKLVAGEEAAVDKEYMIEKLCVFADIDVQTAFVQKFFDGAKDTAKGMRKMIADKKKADAKAAKQDASAPKKERKPRVPKASTEQGADDQVEKKEQGAKKKSKKTSSSSNSDSASRLREEERDGRTASGVDSNRDDAVRSVWVDLDEAHCERVAIASEQDSALIASLDAGIVRLDGVDKRRLGGC